MSEQERQKDGNRRRFRLFVMIAVAAAALYPGWYRHDADAEKRAAKQWTAGEAVKAAVVQQQMEWTDEELAKTYDTVITGGRVINPETQLDGPGWNVGIEGGGIAIVTPKPLKGKKVIDAKGMVVAPGFIDNLSYDPNPLGVWQKIADGVTANIAMHGGTSTPAKWYDYYGRNETPLHYGASFFYTQARNQFRLGRYDSAQPEQIGELTLQAEQALNEGALGISFSLEYVPGITAAEIIPLMELAHEYNVPVYFHARYSDMEPPGTNIEAINELIGYAKQTGASVHIDHINSTGGTFSMKQSLALVEGARDEGLDLTACIYPYDYWGTYLNSTRFDAGWQSRFRISFEDLQIAGTMERLTEQTFARYRSEGKLAVAYAIPEQDVVDALKAPYVMIGSDAILEPGLNNHPRASGTFARTVGLYARERKAITLMDAVAKMSLLPAQRLEKQAPALRRKGRLAKGMDADIVVFDYKTIIDRSTVERPDQTSSGIKHVLIGGRAVLENGKLNKRIRVGEPIRSQFVRLKGVDGELNWGAKQYPVISLYGAHYVDIRALEQHGYRLSWDDVRRVYSAQTQQSGTEQTKDALKALAGMGADSAAVKGTGAAGAVEAGPEAAPSAGQLLLERGYTVETDSGASAALLSVGKQDFIPLSLLGQMGFTVNYDENVWDVAME
ncbi:amidohydrolase family protein [Paenibacillus sp. NEAU-GSW1]|uniref:amidohydrolase family protein n=1 Tax=Paenibacillus sp. NEAU-GSW1 TaxID=2682486 RepID=UPI0012E29F7C|nr:amidohydrolase family protein [Paenibacillus sp. NEAU-GSW1]MUT68415.1 amidohydrolase family protein [Paenibacillus sp. NEAU-GSW1]